MNDRNRVPDFIHGIWLKKREVKSFHKKMATFCVSFRPILQIFQQEYNERVENACGSWNPQDIKSIINLNTGLCNYFEHCLCVSLEQVLYPPIIKCISEYYGNPDMIKLYYWPCSREICSNEHIIISWDRGRQFMIPEQTMKYLEPVLYMFKITQKPMSWRV